MTALTLALGAALAATPFDDSRAAAEARSILAELVAADTTNPPGHEARAVALVAKRLKRAGLSYEITHFAPGRDNLVFRLKGDGSAQPILLLAHLDVVGVKDQAWTSPPHTLTEREGQLVGRGANDDLGMAAVDLAVGLELHRAGTPLHRDLIVAFTGDEESGGAGARWLLAHARDSIAAEVAFNEGGGPLLREDGGIQLVELQTAEKTYQDFTFTASGVTGHSSRPLPENAIVELARALVALGDHPFPERLLPVTRAYFAGRAHFEAGPLGAAMSKLAASAEGAELDPDSLTVVREKPFLAALLHTTCVPTLLSAGTRVNALPASATATINCRLLPDETVADVQAKLAALAGPKVTVAPISDFGSAPPSPLDGPGPAAVLAAAQAIWPQVVVVPVMSAGADDSRFLRAAGLRAYGFSPIAVTEADSTRNHGVDERIPAASLRTGVELFRHLVEQLNK